MCACVVCVCVVVCVFVCGLVCVCVCDLCVCRVCDVCVFVCGFVLLCVCAFVCGLSSLVPHTRSVCLSVVLFCCVCVCDLRSLVPHTLSTRAIPKGPRLAFTRYCYYQSCMVYSIHTGGRKGSLTLSNDRAIVLHQSEQCTWARGGESIV